MSSDDDSTTVSDTSSARSADLVGEILRISGDLDLDVVLQQVADGARSLTGARFGVITALDDSSNVEDVVVSGMGAVGRQALLSHREGERLFNYLRSLGEPLRTGDFLAHVEEAGFTEFKPPVGAFMVTQIRTPDRHVGTISVAGSRGDVGFTSEDEEMLGIFADHAAVAIANAQRHREVQQANADFEALVDASPVGVVVFDAQAHVPVAANREARRILDVPQDPARDLAPLLRRLTFRRLDGSLVLADDLPAMRAARGRESVRAEGLIVVHADGGEVTTVVNAAPVGADNGEIASVVLTVQDITPLEELERLRGEFLGMVSHELRAPLTSIKGAAATARAASSPHDPAETRQLFRIVEEQADHMRDLISNLLDLTRIEAGTLSVTPAATDISEVIQQAESAFSSGGHNNSVVVDLIPELPPVWADRQRLVQVLHTLLSNSARHSRQWSTIRIAAYRQDTHVAVSVTDKGTGIAVAQMPRLFSKFPQLDSGAADTHGRGYGLGLAICKGVVEAHGGRIWAESDGHGQGTRLTFTIPAVDTVEVRDAAADTAAADSPQHTASVERILVVDDDPQMLRYVRNTLAEGGYTAILTGDPGEIGGLLTAEMPHLVLLNLVLPGTDGFEVMKQISSTADVPVIFMSGRHGDRYVARAFEMGAADYVLKPFSPAELLARISATLRRTAHCQQLAPYRTGELVVDFVGSEVTIAEQAVNLTRTEYKLLQELCTNAGRVLTYEQILQRVWGAGDVADVQRIRTVVKDLRLKLGEDARNPTYVFTEPGVGYRVGTLRV